MLVLRLAWRSFVRHKRRSIITASAVALSLALMLFSLGTAIDGHERMAELGIRMGVGHVLVQGRGYQAEQTLDYLVPHPREVMKIAWGLPHVQAVVERLQGTGLLVAGELSSSVTVVGVDPRLEPGASQIAAPKRRVRGTYLRPASEERFRGVPPDIYIGDDLAQKLGVQPGDRVVLTVSPRGSTRPRSAAFVVSGTMRTGVSELDGFYAEIPLIAAQELFAVGSRVTQVAVLLDGQNHAKAAAQQLRQRLGKDAARLEVLPWQQALKELYDALVIDDGGLYVTMGIIFVIVAIGIFNTMLMSVVERTREFGVMMAIGTTGRRLFAIVVTEAALLSLVGVIVGLLLGLALHWWIASTGIDVVKLAGSSYEVAGVAMEGKIYSKLPPVVVLRWSTVVTAMVVASSLYPAWRATRLRPVEAMRHV